MRHFLWAFLFLFLPLRLQAETKEYSLVFIHLGDQLPPYLETAIEQARLFNPDVPILLVANQRALDAAFHFPSDPYLVLVPCESLKTSFKHWLFKQFFPNDRAIFWKWTTERFFYLEELMVDYGLNHVFHLENDVMLYVDLKEMFPVFSDHYRGVAATFDNDERCVAGFIYIRNPQALDPMTSFLQWHAIVGKNEMQNIAAYWQNAPSGMIDSLPIIMDAYRDDHVLKSTSGLKTGCAERYSHLFYAFQSLFDAAALGQYLGGQDPRNGSSSPGFINESCLFNPAHLQYVWEEDHLGRQVPFALYKGGKYRINNLHIHSKNLKAFSSKRFP